MLKVPPLLIVSSKIYTDSRLLPYPRLIHLYSILGLHANKNREVLASRARLAQMLGIYITKDGVTVPNEDYIRKLLKQLESFGYLKREKQIGFNRVGKIVLTDPETYKPVEVANRQVSDEEYKARKNKEYKHYELEELREIDDEIYTLADGSFIFERDVKEERQQFLDGYTDELEFPPAAYAHFNVKRPTFADRI